MIVKSFCLTRKDGVNLYINYSDNGMKILQDQTGILYDYTVDVESAPFTYTETSEPVEDIVDPTPPAPSLEEKAEAYDALMGVDE